MMEVHASKIMWARSVMKHNMRYTIVVSDGDSKSFNAVSEKRPYGPDCMIEKEDYINHVCKRLGFALRNLVADHTRWKERRSPDAKCHPPSLHLFHKSCPE